MVIKRLAVVGSRSYNDYQTVKQTIAALSPSEIISGGAVGADTLAERVASELGIPITVYLPDWDTRGIKAGVLRNRDIVDSADAVLAFWDGSSKGTLNSINLAKSLKKKLYVITSSDAATLY